MKVSDEISKLKKQFEDCSKEMEDFSRFVSHEMKAPLRAVNGYSNLLLEDYGDQLGEEGRNYIDRIRQNADIMLLMLNRITELSRVIRSEINMKHVDLKELFDEICSGFKDRNAERNIRYVLNGLPTVKADRNLMVQLVSDAVSNAVKFTALRDKAIITVNCEEKAEEYIVSVTDNGAGFDMIYSGKLFNVFERLHPSSEFEGVGVGLAIIKKIVQKHGGTVWITGEIDKGASLFFSLPKDSAV